MFFKDLRNKTVIDLDNIDSYKYELPPELIAQSPADPRDSSRLLFLDREKNYLGDYIFRDILDLLPRDCILILNDTRVYKARLRAKRKTGGGVEVFFLKKVQDQCWQVLLKPSARIKKGEKLYFYKDSLDGEKAPEEKSLANMGKTHILNDSSDGEKAPCDFCEMEWATVEDQPGGEIRLLSLEKSPELLMEQRGDMPLPPYITRELKDQERYQTVFSKRAGAVAAPTAGLHFTPGLIERLEARGIKLAYITLHTGLGTFASVRTQYLSHFSMHSEWACIDENTASLINKGRADKRKIIACGTTVIRTLEHFFRDGALYPSQGEVDKFIKPGYKFQVVDGIITNFHLPSTTLLALVCAFGGYYPIMAAYRYAIKKGYPFYSFGSAMMIL